MCVVLLLDDVRFDECSNEDPRALARAQIYIHTYNLSF